MLKNHLKVALRNLRKNKGYSFINIAGLAVGIACCLLIVLFVRDELSYEKFHPSAERIARITYQFNNLQAGVATNNASSPNIVASWLKENFAQVLRTTRLFRPYPQEVFVAHGERVFNETGFVFADSNFFKVFDGYRAKHGNLAAALAAPHTLVITAKMAEKYFGTEDPLGKYLKINHRTERQITAVLEEVAGKSHLTFDFLASDLGIGHAYDLKWDSPNFYTYALLRDPTAARTVASAMNARLDSRVVTLGVQSLRDIHLRSQLVGELQPNGSIRYVYVFSFIALLILVIACINYVNLATARATERAKEVGVLKVMGVHRSALFWKFLVEVFIEIIPALVLALVLVEVLLPWFNGLTSKAVSLNDIPFITMLGTFGMLLLVVSFLSGAYPALVLSGFQPAQVVKGKFETSQRGVALRKVLVVLQFSVSMFLISSVIVIYRQMQYVQDKNLGYNKEQIVVVKLDQPQFAGKIDLLRNEFRALSQVVEVGASMVSPLAVPVAGAGIRVESVTDETQNVSTMAINLHFLARMKLSVISGNNLRAIRGRTGAAVHRERDFCAPLELDARASPRNSGARVLFR
jgi:putative ABC transport system permease protein